jgi:hypothetical protein
MPIKKRPRAFTQSLSSMYLKGKRC